MVCRWFIKIASKQGLDVQILTSKIKIIYLLGIAFLGSPIAPFVVTSGPMALQRRRLRKTLVRYPYLGLIISISVSNVGSSPPCTKMFLESYLVSILIKWHVCCVLFHSRQIIMWLVVSSWLVLELVQDNSIFLVKLNLVYIALESFRTT